MVLLFYKVIIEYEQVTISFFIGFLSSDAAPWDQSTFHSTSIGVGAGMNSVFFFLHSHVSDGMFTTFDIL